jgi:hypothetical protein
MENIAKITQPVENATGDEILIASISYKSRPSFRTSVIAANCGFPHRKTLLRKGMRQGPGHAKQQIQGRAMAASSIRSGPHHLPGVPAREPLNLRYNRGSLEETMRNRLAYLVAAFCVFVCLVSTARIATAQSRMSDKDIEHMMKNLKSDSKQFQSFFNSAISKSTIRKTTQEKDAKTLVKNFRNQTEGMLSTFQRQKRADSSLPLVLDSSQKIDKVLADVSLNASVTSQWAKVKSELGTLAEQFNVPGPAR